MSLPIPFSPCSTATAGQTVKVAANATPTSVAGSIAAAVSQNAASIAVTNTGSVLVFVRLSAEAAPTATAADVPMLPGSKEVFSNPNPEGIIGLAALSSTTTAADVYFTPGQGQ